jgi:hypothetical protein
MTEEAVAKTGRRLAFEAIPKAGDYDSYRRWRFKMLSELTALPKDAKLKAPLVVAWIGEVKTKSMTELATSGDDFIELDFSLFNAIVSACASSVHVLKLESSCDFGAGRQAVKMFDGIYLYNNEESANVAMAQLMRIRCTKMSQLEWFMQEFQTRAATVEAGGNKVPDTMLIELFREGVSGVAELKGVFDTWRLVSGTQTCEALFEMYEKKLK